MLRRLFMTAAAIVVGAGATVLAVPGTSKSDPAPKPRAKASFSLSAATPQVGLKVRLRATGRACSKCRYRWESRRSARRYHRVGTGRTVTVTFRSTGRRTIRLTVVDARGRRFRTARRISVLAAHTRPGAGGGAGGGSGASPGSGAALPTTPAPGSTPLPVKGQPACEAGATPATTAGQVRAAVQAGQSVCVTAAVGNIDLDDLKSATTRFVGTSPSGSIGDIRLNGASGITLRARFGSTVITQAQRITIERSIIGGTAENRILDQLIFIPEQSDDVTIRDNDIGWTRSDNTGNAGYGIRAYNESARLRIERNYLHHLGGDAIQLGMSGPDTLVDRNEIAYVARSPDSNEHSDDLQVTGNGPNMRITNNYMHDNGKLDAGGPSTGGSGPYIHAGDDTSLLFENNLVRDENNFMQIGDLGTGGCLRSNLTFRRNTFVDNGLQFDGAADLQWSLCGGTNNIFERNVVKETFWGEEKFAASGTTARNNLLGSGTTIDARGECTSANCNPAGQEPIGYRKPSGVHW